MRLLCCSCVEDEVCVADMPKEYIYEPWAAPLSVQVKAKCVVGKDYPKPGEMCCWLSIYTVLASRSCCQC